jgi:hypothetical protein
VAVDLTSWTAKANYRSRSAADGGEPCAAKAHLEEENSVNKPQVKKVGEANDGVRIATISAVTSVITALIAAGVTLWVTDAQRQNREEQRAQQAETVLATPSEAEEPSVGGPSVLRTMSATVSYDDDARTDREGPVKADLCVLTSVGSYGGATKGCTLQYDAEGWVLVANGRKATSNCQATCFDFPRSP